MLTHRVCTMVLAYKCITDIIHGVSNVGLHNKQVTHALKIIAVELYYYICKYVYARAIRLLSSYPFMLTAKRNCSETTIIILEN